MENVVFSPYLSEHEPNHLEDALGYALNPDYVQLPVRKSYACECKNCNLTHYTSYKRLNCLFCGSSDPSVFECKELE